MEIKIANSEEQLRQGFWHFKQTGEFCDVTLIAEGKSIRAHRIMLVQASDGFKELLKDKKTEYTLKFTMKMQTLTTLINFIYLGKLSVDLSRAQDLLKELNSLKIAFNKDEIEKKLKGVTKQVPVKHMQRRYTFHNQPPEHHTHAEMFNFIIAGEKADADTAADEDLAMIKGVADKKLFPCENYASCKRVLKSKGGRTTHQKFCKSSNYLKRAQIRSKSLF